MLNVSFQDLLWLLNHSTHAQFQGCKKHKFNKFKNNFVVFIFQLITLLMSLYFQHLFWHYRKLSSFVQNLKNTLKYFAQKCLFRTIK